MKYITKLGIILGFMTLLGCQSAARSSISGTALYLEKKAMPEGAVFEATLEDVSRAGAPAKILGTVIMSSLGQVPISFSIPYDPNEIKEGHRYNLRAKITVGGELVYITKTLNPVLTGNDQESLQVIMKAVHRQGRAMTIEPGGVGPFSGFPLHFLGLLPGTEGNDQYQLDLFSNNTFFKRVVNFQNGKAGQPEDKIGRWIYDEEKKNLVLLDDSNSKELYAVLDPQTIAKRVGGDKNKGIKSDRLQNAHTAQTIEPRVFMHGMYQYMADAAMFRECRTGLKLPVIFEADHISLERAYLGAKTEPGEAIKVHLEGSIVQRPATEGQGSKAHLKVDHFIKLIPGESCDNPSGTATFSNTYWRLTALNGKTIGRDTPMLREAHLVFHKEREGVTRVAGSTGCNSLTGVYELEGQKLTLSQNPMAVTMMACPPGNIESEFVAMLKEVGRYEVSGEHLVLYGEDSREIISRFEATYLR
jgi:copper homeostasis protein (lipoprotein)